MFPTPEQNARLKACRSPDEYDREWERVTEENIRTMDERTAAEIRALREQEYDLWATDLAFENQRRGLDAIEPSSRTTSSDWIGEYDRVVGNSILNQYMTDRFKHRQSLPKIDPNEILNPQPINLTVENKTIATLGIIGILFGIAAVLFVVFQ